MRNKTEEMLDGICVRIKYLTKDLEQEEEHFKVWAASASAYQIAEFAGTYANRVKETYERLNRLYEQKSMLEHLLREEG